MNKDNVYEVEYMLGNEEKSGYVIADNESMASDVAYFLFGEGEDEPYKEIGIYDNSMYDFFVLERENDGSYENEIFETKEEAFSKIGVDGWTMDDLKVYSEGESYDFKKWNFEENLENYLEEWAYLDNDDGEEKFTDEVKKMVETKTPIPDWGAVEVCGKWYFIEYCL